MGVVNVLYVIDTLKIGGAQHHLLSLVKGLDCQRFRPLVCTLGPATDLSRELDRQGVTVRTLDLANIYGRQARREFPRLVGWIREHDVGLVHTYLPSANIYGSLAARLAGVSAVITSRRDMGFSRSKRLGVIEQLFVNPFVQRVMAVCDAVGQKASREWFLHPRKVVTIYNGVDLEPALGSAESGASEVGSDLGVLEERSTVTIVASLSPVKAHEVFLAAAARVIRSGSLASFIVVGDGPRLEECRSLAREYEIDDYVQFTGELSRQRTREVLELTDIGVSTSKTEGMSNALLDFMAQAKPVVASRVGGNPELVDDGRSGLLFPAGDSRALAEALQHLMRDTNLAAEMGRQGQRRIETHFSRERMLREVEALYTEVLGALDTPQQARVARESPERGRS